MTTFLILFSAYFFLRSVWLKIQNNRLRNSLVEELMRHHAQLTAAEDALIQIREEQDADPFKIIVSRN